MIIPRGANLATNSALTESWITFLPLEYNALTSDSLVNPRTADAASG